MPGGSQGQGSLSFRTCFSHGDWTEDRQQGCLRREAPGYDRTITGQDCPLTGMERRLAAPQIFFALGHQKGVTHMTVMKILKEQSLGKGKVSEN